MPCLSGTVSHYIYIQISVPGLGVFFVFRAPAPLAGLAAARLGAAGLERVFWPIQGLLGGPRRGPESLLARPGGLRGGILGVSCASCLAKTPLEPKMCPSWTSPEALAYCIFQYFWPLGRSYTGCLFGCLLGPKLAPSWAQVGTKTARGAVLERVSKGLENELKIYVA